MKLTYPVQLDAEALHYFRCKVLSDQVNAALTKAGIIFHGDSPCVLPRSMIEREGLELFVAALLASFVSPATFSRVAIA